MEGKDVQSMRMTEKMILIGFGLAVLFWIVESLMASFVFQKGDFASQILSAEPYLLWMYCLVLCILIIFGSYAQVIILRLKSTEEALRESEAKYSTLVEHANDGVVIVQDDLCKFANKAMGEISGYSTEKIIDMPFSQILAPESADLVAKMNELNTTEQKIPVTYEVTIQRDDGTTKDVEISASIIQYNGKSAGMGIARDITERKLAEQKLKEQAQELERSNAELEQFAYVASHDLQEPLRMVASYVRLLERRYKGKLDSDADDFIFFAVDGATRMHHLINDLLTYSRVGTHGKHFEETDTTEAVNQALVNLQTTIQDNQAEVIYNGLPKVYADSSQLVQLFQNLISNAIKFCDKQPPHVQISSRQEGNQWVFSVQDNGIGMDMKYSDRIFVIFQRLHDKTESSGTGIGLAICKKIVERHNGNIWVDSEEGKGSTFNFTIPTIGGKQ